MPWCLCGTSPTAAFRWDTLHTVPQLAEDNARLDVAEFGYWRAFFDVRVINPYTPQTEPFHWTPATVDMNVRRDADMRNRYAIKVGHASFLLLVMSYTSGTGPCATNFFKRVAAMRAKKHHSTYSTVITLIQCCLSFALLQSSISCLESARSSFRCPGWVDLRAADLAATVGWLEHEYLTTHFVILSKALTYNCYNA